MRLKFARSRIRIPNVAEFLLIRGLFLLFLISLDRAAFWSCSRNYLRSALRFCVERKVNSAIERLKIMKNVIDFLFRKWIFVRLQLTSVIKPEVTQNHLSLLIIGHIKSK